MSWFSDLEWRGLVHDASDREGVQKLPQGTPFYVGLDPTAPSLQVGNLIPLIVAMRLARAGLQPIILFGGATGAIGDPSGKSTERVLLDHTTVETNLHKQISQVNALWRLAGFEDAPTVVNNHDWTAPLTFLGFLRDIGKHFTINYMLAKDTVKSRLSGDGISYTEFSYMLLQAADFLYLLENRGCRLQIGGSDQWGNITAGLELIRKKTQKEAFALSFPLLTDSEGRKFGMSEGNAVWLDESLTSPYKFHQFFLNAGDGDVIKLLKIFTFRSEAEIGRLAEATRESPEKREAQRALADDLCTLVHGAAATENAQRCAAALFGGTFDGLSDTVLSDLFSDAPSTEITTQEAREIDLVSLLAKTVSKSKGEARRLLAAGGVYIDNVRVSDESLTMEGTALLSRGFIILRSGKKNYHVVRAI